MKYYIITYGCQMNVSDSERIAAVLEKIGYKKAPKIEGAGLIVVNACSIRQSAIDRIWGLTLKFKQLKTKNRKLKTILTGCILKKDLIKFKKHFDYILSIKTLKFWPEFLKEKKYKLGGSTSLRRLNLPKLNYLKIKPKYQTNFSAFVPISNGCNNFCTFCVVPYTRGPEFSRPVEDIINETKSLVRKGYKEIWLLGQNVNSYKSQIPMPNDQSPKENLRFPTGQANPKPQIPINFAKLLKLIDDIPGNFWIRFTSSHPKDISGELIETMAKCKKITPYLNLPVQSGDNKILKNMNRPYTIERYKKIIKKIRTAFKKYRTGLESEIALSTDIIVGFPGETKKQFENTAKLFKEIKFDMAYISQYSPRPGTVAAEMEDNVPKREKKQREKILTEILKETALKNNKKFIGKEIEVLIEKSKNNFLIGKSRHYKTVKIKSNKNLIGKIIKVKITNAFPWNLEGISQIL